MICDIYVSIHPPSGGLGHMAVKFGVAFGAHTTVLSRGTGKRESALNDLKADAYVDVTDKEALKHAAMSFDFILSTISADHDVDMYVKMLKNDGKIVMVGAPDRQLKFFPHPLLGGRRVMAGSMIGGIKEVSWCVCVIHLTSYTIHHTSYIISRPRTCLTSAGARTS
ncbi:hypothetical protein EON63_07525 [archaeon]|nr:MAG: hypothetical protein EON63_07525 [archaeon]